MVGIYLLLVVLDLINAGLWFGLGFPIVGILWLCAAAGCALIAAYEFGR